MRKEKTVTQLVEAIFALDLSRIKSKLMDKREGHGWTCAQADYNELEYKRFLVLRTIYPDESMAPSTEVRKFWHGHILDTRKYADDCHHVFGGFLHHFPYSGMGGEEDAAELVSAFESMLRLHDREFGAERRIASHRSAWQGLTARQPNAADLYGSGLNAPSGREMSAATYQRQPALSANAESA